MKVNFTETVLRDANQSLIATRMPYELHIANMLFGCCTNFLTCDRFTAGCISHRKR